MYLAEAYSKPNQTSKMEIFYKSYQLFSGKAPSQISDRVLNTPLILNNKMYLKLIHT